jgi:ABC-type sugar transport system ATPase subunit
MSFGATCALSDVSLRFEAGEVHVIAGANGAGKSTLIKIISGVHADYTGEVVLGGQPVRFIQPLAARRGGIATIHQELSLAQAELLHEQARIELQTHLPEHAACASER